MNRLRHRGAGTLLSLFLVPALAVSASAQVVVGSSAKPQIEIDATVLDRLGSAPTLPDLFRGTGPAAVQGEEPPVNGGRAPELHRPQHPIVLKKPVHKPNKPKTSVAIKPHAKTVTAKIAVTAPVSAPTPPAPTPSAEPVAPTPASVSAPPPKTESAPSQPALSAETAPSAAPANLPVVSLPAIAAQEAPPAASSDKAPVATGKPEKTLDSKRASAAASDKADHQPAPPEPVKLVPTPTPPVPDKVPPAPVASMTAPSVQLPPAAPPAATALTPPVQTPQAQIPQAQIPQAQTAQTSTPAQTAPALSDSSLPSSPTASAPMPPPPREQQEARLPPPAMAPTAPAAPPTPTATSTEAPMTILFEKDGARLPDEVRTALNQMAERLAADGALQLQLLAYAEGDEDNASKARRLSLSRALAVRSYLIDQGVRSTRIEVRALGNKVPEGPADRVDILVQKR